MAVEWFGLVSAVSELTKGAASLLATRKAAGESLDARIAAIEAHEQEQGVVVEELAVQLRTLVEATQAVDRRVTTAIITAAVSALLAIAAMVIALV